MTARPTLLLAGLLGALAAPALADTAPSLPGGANSLQETYDSWTVVCAVQTGVKRCALSQQQADGQSHQQVLAIELAPSAANRVDGTLVLPFGLALDSGVKLQIDDAAPGTAMHFRTCLPIGCLVSLSFDASSIVALRKGAVLKINTVADGGKDTPFSISLKGFPNALDRTAALLK